jgi:replicative DNA helicase
MGKRDLRTHVGANVQAEHQLVGALLRGDADICSRVVPQLRNDDLMDPGLADIVKAMKSCEEEALPISVLTVGNKLGQQLGDIGGLAWLEDLARRSDAKVGADAALKIVKGSVMRRQLLALIDKVRPDIEGGRVSAGDAIHGIYEGLDLIEQLAPSEQNERLASLMECSMSAVDAIQAAAEKADPDGVTGIRMGFPSIDRELGGMQRGDLIVLAARPSQGKTALAMNIADHVGRTEKMPVVVFSMEMNGTQLAMRMMASDTGIDQKRLRTGQLEKDDWSRLVETVESMRGVSCWIDSSSVTSIGKMRSSLRKLLRTLGQLGLVVVDYLQLVSGTAPDKESRATVVSAISKGLKRIAKEFDVPVLALSQLTRTVDARPDKRPIMSDLRESGSIEQDADVVLFIYRDEVYHADTRNPGEAELIISKQRNGPIGMVRLGFDKGTTRFRELGS